MSDERRRSEVIRFPLRRLSTPGRIGSRTEGGGTVLLFTGVRYERAAELTLTPPPADRPEATGDRRVGG